MREAANLNDVIGVGPIGQNVADRAGAAEQTIAVVVDGGRIAV